MASRLGARPIDDNGRYLFPLRVTSVIVTLVIVYGSSMTVAPALTPEACRAARALLRWSVRDLMREAGASPNTVTKFEGGGEIRPETAAKIVAAFARYGVEVLGDGAPGARLHPIRRADH